MSQPFGDSTPGIVYNSQQLAALDRIMRFLEIKDKLFILQGYAGTGKTTLVKEILARTSIPLSRIALVAPTNRAAKVLANKTGLHTMTIHRLIYLTVREELDYQRERLEMWRDASNFTEIADLVIESNDVDLEEMWREFLTELGEEAPAEGSQEYERLYESWMEERRILTLKYEGITLPDDPAERLDYFLKVQAEKIAEHTREIRQLLDEDLKVRKKLPADILPRFSLFIVDEASMVNEQIGRDLTSYGIPTILVGDPFQLPPVKAKPFWHKMRADAVLTKIERQKGPGAGIPLAGERIRNGLDLEPNESISLHRQGTLPSDYFLSADQIIVGTHRTRERICRVMRKLKGHTTPYPQVGEKIVSVHNDKVKGIMNGELYEVVSSELLNSKIAKVDIRDPYGKTIPGVTLWVEGLEGRGKTDFLTDSHGKFWWGYAITCHQSQGSEWPHVIVCDEWPGDSHDRWLYTGITRASLKCEVIR